MFYLYLKNNYSTYLKAIVTRVTGEPLSKAATNVLLGKTLDWILTSFFTAGAAWA